MGGGGMTVTSERFGWPPPDYFAFSRPQEAFFRPRRRGTFRPRG